MEYTVKLTRDQIEIAIKACRTYARVPLVPTKARWTPGRWQDVSASCGRTGPNYDRA